MDRGRWEETYQVYPSTVQISIPSCRGRVTPRREQRQRRQVTLCRSVRGVGAAGAGRSRCDYCTCPGFRSAWAEPTKGHDLLRSRQAHRRCRCRPNFSGSVDSQGQLTGRRIGPWLQGSRSWVRRSASTKSSRSCIRRPLAPSTALAPSVPADRETPPPRARGRPIAPRGARASCARCGTRSRYTTPPASTPTSCSGRASRSSSVPGSSSAPPTPATATGPRSTKSERVLLAPITSPTSTPSPSPASSPEGLKSATACSTPSSAPSWRGWSSSRNRRAGPTAI